LESLQTIVLFVTPATSELADALISVSGVSVNETPFGVPLAQVAASVTVTLLDVVSIA